jgi:iron complex outermembrane receptor protein
MIEIQAKRYEAGIVKLKQANDAVPAPNVLFNIGRAYRDAGELEKSVEYLRKYVATNPTDREDVEKAIARTEEELRAKGGTKP